VSRLLFVLVLLGLCFDGWGCGGSPPDEPEPFGWCCGGACGLDAYDADTFEVCTCAGLVHPVPGTRGECQERYQ
jgi:hypothetical protein